MARLRRCLTILCAFCLLLSLPGCVINGSPTTHHADSTLPGVESQWWIPPSTTEAPSSSTAESTPASTAKPSTAPPVTTTAESTAPPATEESSVESSGTEESTEPGPSPEEVAQAYLDRMDGRSKLFQLMIVLPEAICWDNPVLVPDNQELSSKPVGGILYQAKNMADKEQLSSLVEGHQEASTLPLFICVDEEGGRVSRIMQTMGTTPIKNMYTYRGDGPEKARINALTLAKDISRFGFNTDFAPVADVWSNPENKVIGERAYSDDFKKAARLVESAVKGFHEGGAICTLKHFPGHGDTLEDSHDHTAMVSKNLAQLRKEEFLPFAAGIKAGADMVMTGHLLVPKIDKDNIATFSHKILTEILREELGFEGLIITDSLEMAGVSSISTGGEACLKALLAGCDLLLCPAGQPEKLVECVDFLLGAIQEGKLSWERVNESVLRVLKLKVQYGLMEQAWPAEPETSARTVPETTWTAPETTPWAAPETTWAEAETPVWTAPEGESPAEAESRTEAWSETEAPSQTEAGASEADSTAAP